MKKAMETVRIPFLYFMISCLPFEKMSILPDQTQLKT